MDASHAVLVTQDHVPANYKNSAEQHFGEPHMIQLKPPFRTLAHGHWKMTGHLV